MADLNEALVSCEGHDKYRELDDCRFFVLFNIDFINGEFFFNFFLLLYFL